MLPAVLLAAAMVAGPGPVAADDELEFGLETHRLAQIRITGNAAFDDQDLKGLLRIQEGSWKRPLHVARYRPHLVDIQLRILQTFYRNQGFHQAVVALDSITALPDQGDVLHIGITEGARTVLRRVSFTGHEPLTAEDLRKVMHFLRGGARPGRPERAGPRHLRHA